MTNPTTVYNEQTDDVLLQPSAFRLPKPSISLIAAAATICVLGIVAIISPFFFSEIINVVLGCVMIGTGLTFAFHIHLLAEYVSCMYSHAIQHLFRVFPAGNTTIG